MYAAALILPLTYVIFNAYLYKSFINPVTFLVLKDWALVVFFPLMLLIVFDIRQFEDYESMLLNYGLFTVYFLGIIAASLLMLFFTKRIKSSVTLHLSDFIPANKQLLLYAFAILFCLLMVLSPMGLSWIFDSRNAYQFGREGLGPLYATLQLILSVLALLAGVRGPSAYREIIFYIILAFFLGSKSSIIYLLIIFYSTGILTNSIPRNLAKEFIGLCLLMFFMITLVYYMGDAGSTFSESLHYFDHAITLVNGIQALGDFQPNIWFSKVWEYVPRALYSDKPFVYGDIYLTEILAPGAAETGHTLGGASYSTAALSFSYVGVFVFSFIQALFCQFLYVQTKRNRSILAIALFVHFAIVDVAKYFPTIFAIIIISILLVIARLRFRVIS